MAEIKHEIRLMEAADARVPVERARLLIDRVGEAAAEAVPGS